MSARITNATQFNQNRRTSHRKDITVVTELSPVSWPYADAIEKGTGSAAWKKSCKAPAIRFWGVCVAARVDWSSGDARRGADRSWRPRSAR